MKEVKDFLKECEVYYLATGDVDNCEILKEIVLDTYKDLNK